MDRILIILKKENGPRASSAPALGLNTIIFKYVYWYMKQISGERLQDHWSSGFEALIKFEDAGEATTLKIDFSNIQGQLTLQSRVELGSNWYSSKMLWLSLFLPRMKKIRSKLKGLEWPQYKILIFQTLKGS